MTYKIKVTIDGEWHNCYIPEYNIHYCTKVKTDVERKAKTMVEMYEKFIEENPQYKK